MISLTWQEYRSGCRFYNSESNLFEIHTWGRSTILWEAILHPFYTDIYTSGGHLDWQVAVVCNHLHQLLNCRHNIYHKLISIKIGKVVKLYPKINENNDRISELYPFYLVFSTIRTHKRFQCILIPLPGKASLTKFMSTR